mmetsp:Transcript_1885/g.2635  ORF Transcript_1885/g.2635 Transcript_1885/m.2635 type:complete len:321 (+) Transcript_1885:155-1117(+)
MLRKHNCCMAVNAAQRLQIATTSNSWNRHYCTGRVLANAYHIRNSSIITAPVHVLRPDRSTNSTRQSYNCSSIQTCHYHSSPIVSMSRRRKSKKKHTNDTQQNKDIKKNNKHHDNNNNNNNKKRKKKKDTDESQSYNHKSKFRNKNNRTQKQSIDHHDGKPKMLRPLKQQQNNATTTQEQLEFSLLSTTTSTVDKDNLPPPIILDEVFRSIPTTSQKIEKSNSNDHDDKESYDYVVVRKKKSKKKKTRNDTDTNNNNDDDFIAAYPRPDERVVFPKFKKESRQKSKFTNPRHQDNANNNFLDGLASYWTSPSVTRNHNDS